MLKQVQKTKTNQKGFTIIEVLIVLAIAGLILLIVFLAVPALQRNSRNTQRKNDVSALLAGVNDYQSNNSGTLPVSTTPPTYATGTLTWAAPAGSVPAETKLGYYTSGVGAGAGQVQLAANSTATPVPGGVIAATADRVIVAPGTVCSGAASVAGSARSVTAIFVVESGAGKYSQVCQGS